jgi:hypothetical protein
MKEDNIRVFFNHHKETISGESFNARLFNTLDVLPQPETQRRKAPFIEAISACIGVLLFVFFGGYGVLMNGLACIGQVFVDVHTLSADVLSACIMLALLFVALIRFAVRTYHQ